MCACAWISGAYVSDGRRYPWAGPVRALSVVSATVHLTTVAGGTSLCSASRIAGSRIPGARPSSFPNTPSPSARLVRPCSSIQPLAGYSQSFGVQRQRPGKAARTSKAAHARTHAPASAAFRTSAHRAPNTSATRGRLWCKRCVSAPATHMCPQTRVAGAGGWPPPPSLPRLRAVV